MNKKNVIILGIALLIFGSFFYFVPPMSQNHEYFNFADRRLIWGIPNFFDVVSNIPFLILGFLGVQRLQKSKKWSYLVFFIMIFCTGIGSAYFHLLISIDSLFWDRLPIALAFMALMAGVVGDRTKPDVGNRILVPLLLLGGFSAIHWFVGEKSGHGDLRLYLLVQFGSMILLLGLLAFVPSRYSGNRWLWMGLGAYVVAKIFETFDRPVFQITGFLSGHTIKHLAAGLGTYCVLQMFNEREKIRKFF